VRDAKTAKNLADDGGIFEKPCKERKLWWGEGPGTFPLLGVTGCLGEGTPTVVRGMKKKERGGHVWESWNGQCASAALVGRARLRRRHHGTEWGVPLTISEFYGARTPEKGLRKRKKNSRRGRSLKSKNNEEKVNRSASQEDLR